MRELSTGYLASLSPKTRNVNNLIQFSGTASNSSVIFWPLSKIDYDKITKFLTENLGVNISQDGLITTYIPPAPPPIPLTDQAQSALSDIQSQTPMLIAIGETFAPKTRDYLKTMQIHKASQAKFSTYS